MLVCMRANDAYVHAYVPLHFSYMLFFLLQPACQMELSWVDKDRARNSTAPSAPDTPPPTPAVAAPPASSAPVTDHTAFEANILAKLMAAAKKPQV